MIITWSTLHKSNSNTNPKHQFQALTTPVQDSLFIFLFLWANVVLTTWTHMHAHMHGYSRFAILPTKRLSSLLSNTQAGSQRKPMDQFSAEKLWHSSNVKGFDVDAELHCRTPLKPVKPLFIRLFPMQRTLAENVPHFCCVFFLFFLFTEKCGSCTPTRTSISCMRNENLRVSLPTLWPRFATLTSILRFPLVLRRFSVCISKTLIVRDCPLVEGFFKAVFPTSDPSIYNIGQDYGRNCDLIEIWVEMF